MKKKKFTFKTERWKGRFASFHPPSHHIKLNKEDFGMIDDKVPHTIKFQVFKADIMEDGNPNCPWKWISLKKKSETLQEAKDFINENIDALLEKYKMWYGPEKAKWEEEHRRA